MHERSFLGVKMNLGQLLVYGQHFLSCLYFIYVIKICVQFLDD